MVLSLMCCFTVSSVCECVLFYVKVCANVLFYVWLWVALYCYAQVRYDCMCVSQEAQGTPLTDRA